MPERSSSDRLGDPLGERRERLRELLLLEPVGERPGPAADREGEHDRADPRRRRDQGEREALRPDSAPVASPIPARIRKATLARLVIRKKATVRRAM